MNKKVKTTLILTGTLVLGIIIGVMISGMVVRQGIQRVGRFMSDQGFKEDVVALTDPNPQQLKQIDAIFEGRQGNISEEMDNHFEKMKEIRDTYMDDLRQVLTPEQFEQLNRVTERMRSRRDHFRQRFGHPHRGRMGPGWGKDPGMGRGPGMRGGPMGFRSGMLEQKVMDVTEADEQQKEQIQQLFEQHREAMWKDGSPGRREGRAQMDSLLKEIEEVLDQEQKEKLREFWRDWRF